MTLILNLPEEKSKIVKEFYSDLNKCNFFPFDENKIKKRLLKAKADMKK